MFLPTFAAGVRGSHFIDPNNHCWAVGCNSFGQLGADQPARFSCTPIQLEGEATVVSSGLNHTLLLDHQRNVRGIGVLSCCLNETISQLGPISAISCGDFYSLGLSEQGEVYVKGKIMDHQVYTIPTRLEISVPIKQIASGKCHLMLLDFEGSVWAMGSNTSNQLGVPSINHLNKPQKLGNLPHPMKSVACGGYHTLLLDETGAVYSCGKNSYGQLGLGDNIDRQEFEKIVFEVIIQQIAGGGLHSLFLDPQGVAFACGNNSKGQIGIKNATMPPYPCIPSIKAIKRANKKLKKKQIDDLYQKEFQQYQREQQTYWHHKSYNKARFSLHKINFPEEVSVQCFSAGYLHSLFVDAVGSLWSCGDNENGQLATGDKSNREFPHKIEGFEVLTTLMEPIIMKNARKIG